MGCGLNSGRIDERLRSRAGDARGGDETAEGCLS